MLSNKMSLNKFKNIKIIKSIFSGYCEMKLEVNSRRNTGKFTNMGNLKNNNWTSDQKEIKRKIRKFLQMNKNDNTI
jgi:hypothetical protein